ncbi:MAG TPA: hypothetical protein VFP68_11205 [Burkholderiaceae bacterium]|nr:hypothetical protein [Burkholderiaceae bacterium]
MIMALAEAVDWLDNVTASNGSPLRRITAVAPVSAPSGNVHP